MTGCMIHRIIKLEFGRVRPGSKFIPPGLNDNIPSSTFSSFDRRSRRASTEATLKEPTPYSQRGQALCGATGNENNGHVAQ